MNSKTRRTRTTWARKDDPVTKTTTRTAALSLLLLVATACSPAPGTPSPAYPSNIPTSAASTGPKEPQVTNPLDATKFEQNPCSALTQAQAAQVFNAVRNRKITGNVAPICTWNDNNDNSLSLGFLPGQGLSASYENGTNAGGGLLRSSPHGLRVPGHIFGRHR
ncbi:DUF3558 family protein [Amycolatopsis sulphurea]|uniref:DUF3558 family protein n=1 Tax=Amycolatopsis sulphurea TaxID=76022 RepID=UPI0036919889